MGCGGISLNILDALCLVTLSIAWNGPAGWVLYLLYIYSPLLYYLDARQIMGMALVHVHHKAVDITGR